MDDWSWVNTWNQTGQLSTWSPWGNPTPVSFSIPRWSFTRTHHQSNPTPVPSLSDEVLHRLIIRKPYTGSFSISDEVSHGLIIRQPYTGSFSGNFRWSFTQTHHQATLHRFLPPFQMKFYTDSSWSNSTPVPPISDEVLHRLIIRKLYPGSFSLPDVVLHELIIKQPNLPIQFRCIPYTDAMLENRYSPAITSGWHL